MFGLFKKEDLWDNKTILAPADGAVVPLSEVDDPVFSTGAMGDGIAIDPSDDKIYSPVSGEVTLVAPTKHGIGLKTDSGMEVLIHLGIDTVELNGAPFDINVKPGEKIKAGKLLGLMNRNQVESAGKKTTIMVLLTSGEKLEPETGSISHGDIIARLK